MQPEPLWSRAAVARLLACTPRNLDRIRQLDRDFPRPIMVTPRTPRWRREDIERWLASKVRAS